MRASLEEIALLGLGLAQYWENKSANSAEWDLDCTWEDFQKKLDGRVASFDTNRFDTNWVTHPVGGWLYDVAARGNRLDWASRSSSRSRRRRCGRT